jgi:hypothetical protein
VRRTIYAGERVEDVTTKGAKAVWSLLLSKPIKLDNGQVLRTLEDVRQLVISIPPDLARHEKWLCLAELMVGVAVEDDQELVEAVSAQLRHCLETPPYASVRLMPEPPCIKRRGAGHQRKKTVS